MRKESGLRCPSAITAAQPQGDAGEPGGRLLSSYCRRHFHISPQLPGSGSCGPAVQGSPQALELHTAPCLVPHSAGHGRKLSWGTGVVSLWLVGGEFSTLSPAQGPGGTCKFRNALYPEDEMKILGDLELKKKNATLTSYFYFLE